ncbi:hypothetical protein OG610_40515 (plasmid) [Streptomyces anulatus]
MFIHGIGGVPERPQNHQWMVEFTRMNEIGPLTEREPHSFRRVVGHPAGGDAAPGVRSQSGMENLGEVTGKRLLPFPSRASQRTSPSEQQMIMQPGASRRIQRGTQQRQHRVTGVPPQRLVQEPSILVRHGSPFCT